MDGRLGKLLTCLFTIQTCFAYQMYQERFPNGNMVPHPCKPNVLWKGVGHTNLNGGGLRNPFGDDFKNNGGIWNEAICRKDSDIDGKTNGEELGDPECIWSIGKQPSVTRGISHPGICEPITDINKCGSKSDWVNCKDEGFECPVLNEPETFNITIRIPVTPVPAVETTYICRYFELPTDQEYHMVADTPYIDNEAVLHHMTVYGCNIDITNDVPLNTQLECGMVSNDNCDSILTVWAINVAGTCPPEDAGVLIGGSKGFRYAVLQLHWHNPELLSGLTDSSGMNLFLTPKLRKFNTGVAVLSQFQLEIPPGEPSTVQTGKFSGKCSSKYMLGPVNITRVFHHMHDIGRSMATKLKKYDGEKVETFAEDIIFHSSLFHKDEIVRNITEKCGIIQCRRECKEYIKVLKSTDPCYQGDVYKFRKSNVFKPPIGEEKELTLEDLQFYSRVDSCDKEMTLENIMKTMGGKTGGETGGETGGASEVMASLFACFMGLLLTRVI